MHQQRSGKVPDAENDRRKAELLQEPARRPSDLSLFSIASLNI
jgi:hypothetical protein